MTINGTASAARGRRLLFGLVALAVAAALWLPAAHLFFRVDPDEFFRDPALEARHAGVWIDPARREREIATLRRGEVGEWDFMWRTFTAWSLCNLALREPARAKERLDVVDSIIDDTLRLEREKGFRHFLLPYGKLGDPLGAPAALPGTAVYPARLIRSSRARRISGADRWTRAPCPGSTHSKS